MRPNTLYLYVTSGHSRVQVLRGGAAFGILVSRGESVVVAPSLTAINELQHLYGSFRILITCPADPRAAEAIQAVQQLPDCCVLVDVHHPLTRPTTNVELEPGGQDFWGSPEVIEAAKAAIRAADGTTTPTPKWEGFETWSDELVELNGNCHIIPDIGRISPDEYLDRLSDAWAEGLRRRRREADDVLA